MTDQKNKQPQSGQDQKNQGKAQSTQDPSKSQQHTPRKGNMADDEEPVRKGADIENPDQDDQPDKQLNIDDDPDQTRKKVPNMQK